MKTRLFNIAWATRKHFKTLGEALAHAWKVIKLQFQLCIGVALFKYKKIDGSIREARGSNETLPVKEGPRKPINFGVLTYFDPDANDFRSAKIENLIL